MRKRRATIDGRQILEAVPRLNPRVRWEPLDSGGMLAVYRRRAGRLTRLVRIALALSDTRQVFLDETGARVVRCIDGRRTVADLASSLAADLNISRSESEAALIRYLGMLGRRELVAFVLPAATGPSS